MKLHKSIAAAFCALALSGSAAAASPLEETYTTLPLKQVKTEGTLVFSDCPEYAKMPGILYAGTVKEGKGRLYYYHVNELGEPARLVVYAKSEDPQDIRVTRTLKGDPSRSYIPTGSTLSFREAVSGEQKEITISLPAKKRTILFEEDKKGIRVDDLVSGLVEIRTEKPVKLGAAIFPLDDDKTIQEELDIASPLPPDSHEMRGTFASDIYYESEPWDFSKGNAEIVVGESFPFQQGPDEMSTVTRENTGDYGITYHMRIPTTGEGKYKLYINPLGGVYMGTFQIGQHEKILPIYRTDDRRSRGWFGHDTIEDYMEAGTWDAGKDLFLRFIPAGATYLPIRFLLVKV